MDGGEMRRIPGLRALADRYDALLCDVWGVLHNGVAAYPDAIDALRRFRAERGPVVLVTNAPRPAASIREQLRILAVPEDAYDSVVTSGDVTRAVIAERPGARLLHIGPTRDLPFYQGLDVRLVAEDAAELVSCTGLVDDLTETPADYRDRLTRLARRDLVMVCANPDLVVERGGELVYCAGALARLYVELGGRAVLVGKPHAPIYAATRKLIADLGGSSVLAVGDSLLTDIRGALDNGLPALFVTGGIHAADFGPRDAPDEARIAARLSAEGLAVVGFMPTLFWAGTAPGSA
jgi:HAD superfamily hydrolase (TIGR01459 family)